MFAPEKPIKEPPSKMDWKPILRLLIMTVVFTLVILGSGELVKFVTTAARTLPDTAALIVTAAMGVIGMGIAVVLGCGPASGSAWAIRKPVTINPSPGG